MDVGRAFRFVQEDEKWVSKLGIGGLVILIPVVGALAFYGYMTQTARNVLRGEARPLPEWGDFGALVMRGLYAVVVLFGYSFIAALPILPFYFCLIGIMAALVSSTATNDTNVQMLGVIIPLLYLPFILILTLVSTFFTVVGLARYVQTDSLDGAFQLGEVYRMVRADWRRWLRLSVLYWLCALVGALGVVACGIGAFFTSMYAYGAVFAHLLGQFVRELESVPPADLSPTSNEPPPLISV